MVCDIGGFAAATFKRGMRCINIPTTLLAAVDASVGVRPALISTASRTGSAHSASR